MLNKLMQAAKKENWAFVDENIQEAVKDPEIVQWAYDRGMDNPNKHIRDLAASIIEKAKISVRKFNEMRNRLYDHMQGDSNPYARYHLAFALARHGVGSYLDSVRKTLQEAKQDRDVSKDAQKYLKKLD